MAALFTVPTDTFNMEVESKRCNNGKKILFRLTFLFYFSIFILGADRIQSYLEGRHILPQEIPRSENPEYLGGYGTMYMIEKLSK